MDFVHFKQTVVSPALQAVIAHWDEARGPAAMPSWEQLKPSRMAPHLSILWAYRYDRDADDFMGRLAGNKISWGFKTNFRGMSLRDAYPPAVAARCHQIMLRIISEPVICRRAGVLFKQAGRDVEGERIALPLASDGLHGDGVLGASVYRYPLRHLGHGPVEFFPEAEEYSFVADPAPHVPQACAN